MTEQLAIKVSEQTFNVETHLYVSNNSTFAIKYNHNTLLKNNNYNYSLTTHSPPLSSAFPSNCRFYGPENLDLIKTLEMAGEHNWKRHAWKLYYVLTVVYKARWNKAFEEDDFAPVSSKILEKVIGSHFACRAKRLLVALKILESDNRYIVGERCKGYRFCEPYQSARFRESKVSMPIKSAALLKALPKMVSRKDCLEHEFLCNNLSRLTIDDAVDQFFWTFNPISARQADYYGRSVEWVREREGFFCYDAKTGRVFNNVTSLPKELRPFLRLDGRPLVEIDVANCQPFLLLGLYKGEPERDEYQEIVQSGNFYESIDRELENPFGPDRRKELKKAVFTQVFFDRIRPSPTKLCQAFARRFPILFQRIQALKDPHHRCCALWLQKQEADIVISGVVGKIARGPKFPVLTIHDSILTLPEFVSHATSIFQEEFESRFGFHPEFRTTDYGLPQSATAEKPLGTGSKRP